LRERALARRRQAGALPIFGSDLYGEQLQRARASLEAAGLAAAVQLKQGNVLEIRAPAPCGVLVANPPYGERMGEAEQLAEFYPRLGDALKKNFSGWRCYFLSADKTLPKLLGLRSSRRIALHNGPLECRLYEYRVVKGELRGEPHS
jgi:putative N6-adenine-specific DNA methylase